MTAEPASSPSSTDLSARGITPVSMSLYDRDFQAFADALGGSFERYGFAVIADHGLEQAVIDGALKDAKAFFALPEDVKRAYHLPGTARPDSLRRRGGQGGGGGRPQGVLARRPRTARGPSLS